MKPLFWYGIIKGVAVAVVSTIVLLCAFTLLSLKADDPGKNLSLYANIVLYVAVALGGAVSARKAEKTALSGVVCGLICMILVLLPSIVFSSWGADSLLRAALTVLSALVGAWLTALGGSRRSSRGDARYRKRIAKKYGRA